MAALVAFGPGFERPAALLWLALPLCLWLAARAPRELPAIATGAFEIWRALAQRAPESPERARRSLPPPLRWVLAALVLGALAAAGPRWRAARAPRTWTVLVDSSPSTGLPLGDGRTRSEAALEAARAWLAEAGRSGDRVRWSSPARAALELAWDEEPPAAWLAPPAWFAPEPDFAVHDWPLTLWVTDRAPVEPERAGCFASGGPAVPGPVACAGTTRIDWDGAALHESEAALPPRARACAPDCAALPRELRELFELWADERGLVAGGDEPPALVLEAVPQGELAPVDVGRDGWRLRGRALAHGLPESACLAPGGERWLATGAAGGGQATLVYASPGRIVLGLRDVERLTGDAAAFALSWSRLFDRCALPPPSIVPLAERGDAGPARSTPPADDGGRAAPGRPGGLGGLDAWLALAAALCAAAAFVASRGRPDAEAGAEAP